jgi:hypothetical protein
MSEAEGAARPHNEAITQAYRSSQAPIDLGEYRKRKEEDFLDPEDKEFFQWPPTGVFW